MIEKLEKLRSCMRFDRLCFYFTRNNPAHTNRYYCRFIEIIGPERYLCSPFVRNEWEGARYNIDKMYGLICAWCKDFSILNTDDSLINDLQKYFCSFYCREIDTLKKACDSFEGELVDFIRASDESEAKSRFKNFMSIKERILTLEIKEEDKKEAGYSSLRSEVKKSEEIIEIYRQLADFATCEKDLFAKKFNDEKNKQEKNKSEENKTEEKK